MKRDALKEGEKGRKEEWIAEDGEKEERNVEGDQKIGQSSGMKKEKEKKKEEEERRKKERKRDGDGG